MRITLGLNETDSLEDIIEFARQGADEFFLGFIPSEWYNQYGWEVSLNRREFGPQVQFTDYKKLEDVISVVHQQNKKVFITLNAHQHTEEQLSLVRNIVSKLENLEPDGYIMADSALMVMLRKWGIKRSLHLSTGAACFNSETIKYFSENIGMSRIILPRKLSLEEMNELINNCQDLKVKFEVMIIHSRCFFNDEYCFSWHSGNSPNFCSFFGLGEKHVSKRFPYSWKQTVEKISKNPQSQFKENSLLDIFLKKTTSNLKEPKINSFLKTEEISEETKGVHPKLPFIIFAVCGLCAIPRLKNIGISVLKIPARGASGGAEAKKKYLQMVGKVIEHPNPTKEFCQSLINSPGFCSGLGRCYYYLGS